MSEQTETLHRVRIVTLVGQPTVEIDGVDVSSLIGAYQVRHDAGQHPQVILKVSGRWPAELEGLARVVVGVPPDPGPAAAAFLQAIDARQLEGAALARFDLMDGQPHELTRAMLHLLTEWANGQWSGPEGS
ncbi:hypothetical protein ACFWF9_02665 [Streptomyces roseolus]|uniref:hypothetical protein n=1 Tax=Streptomyces TaxID=1883 RepID=UPI0036649123